jgi:hypothetical protein
MAMKPGALLVDIARGALVGALVDEDALKAGLDRDQPATAVLDVFRTEPLPADSRLWDHPKVRISGHCSNAGDGVVAGAMRCSWRISAPLPRRRAAPERGAAKRSRPVTRPAEISHSAVNDRHRGRH